MSTQVDLEKEVAATAIALVGEVKDAHLLDGSEVKIYHPRKVQELLNGFDPLNGLYQEQGQPKVKVTSVLYRNTSTHYGILLDLDKDNMQHFPARLTQGFVREYQEKK